MACPKFDWPRILLFSSWFGVRTHTHTHARNGRFVKEGRKEADRHTWSLFPSFFSCPLLNHILPSKSHPSATPSPGLTFFSFSLCSPHLYYSLLVFDSFPHFFFLLALYQSLLFFGTSLHLHLHPLSASHPAFQYIQQTSIRNQNSYNTYRQTDIMPISVESRNLDMGDSFGQDWTHPTRSASSLRTLIVDNYDSYTFNLLQLFEEDQLKNVVVIRNDQFEW